MAGFVDRGRHPTDRRATLLTLADHGRTLVASWRAEREEGAGHLFAGTSAAELNTFVSALDRVMHGLRETHPQQ